ncbi:MAG: hypothetical protein ACYC7E_21340 [Armatimonadota bacterium]
MADTTEVQHVRDSFDLILGRFAGILVFLGGVVLLALTFVLAYQAFHDPERIIALNDLKGAVFLPPWVAYLPALLRLVLVFVMGFVSSLIAARGVQLFFSAKKQGETLALAEPSVQAAGRYLGLVVFLVGIALLSLIWFISYQAYLIPKLIIPLDLALESARPSPDLIILPALFRLILMTAMGVLSSLIAARGAQLFFTARKEERRESTHRD